MNQPTTRRGTYLKANRDFSEALLKLVMDAARAGLSRETIAGALNRAAIGDQELAEHVILLGDLLEGELAKPASTEEPGA